MSLIAELKRRNVFRVGAAYAIVAWLLVEVASVFLPALRLPEWTLTFLVFLVVVGFPLALVFAWAFELTPEGIKREKEVERSESITHMTGRKLDFAIIGLLVIAVAFLVIDNYVLEDGPEQAEVAAERVSGEEWDARDGSIAVLPFANRSANEADAFFVDGMHDDILTHLARIRSLKVISRTSVMEYRNTTKNLKTIGRELGATTVLEGGVQRAGTQIRVNVQLIDAETDEHLWADIYDRELTAANIFAIQTEIATAIADALRATLSKEEQSRIADVPTENLEAYEAYLLGKQRLARRTTVAFAQAVDYFQRAIQLDPAFALAYVGLAETYVLQAFYSGLPPKETLAKARVAAEQALALNDQLGEAHNALAAVKEDTNDDFEGAEASYKRAIELNPNHALSYHWYGWMLRSRLGRPEEALELHRRASELDPLSGVMAINVAADLEALGRFEEAEKWLDKTMELTPNYPDLHTAIGDFRSLVDGRLDEAIVAYTKALSLDPDNVSCLGALGFAYLNLGDPSQAERFIDRSIELGPESTFPNAAMVALEVYRGNEAGAVEHARRAIAAGQILVISRSFLADHALKAGRNAEALALYEEYTPELLSEENPRVDRSNYEAAIDLALIFSRSGDQQRANRLLDRSLQQIQQIPRLGRPGYGIADARIYAIRGERQKSLSALRFAIDEGWHEFWWYVLEHDSSLESLHDEPEFRAMVEEIRAKMAAQLARVREMERNGELEPIPEVSAVAQ